MNTLRPPHIEYGNQWLLLKDVNGRLRGEQQRYNAVGDQIVGFAYVDHQAGLSLHVHLFCQFNVFGKIKKTVDLQAQKIALILRYDMFQQLEIKALSADQRQALDLPEQPEYLSAYEHPEVALLRSIALIHPLRAPGFPDDIRFVMAQPGKQVEQVWGRLERRLDKDLYECTLLNQPRQDFGVQAGERVAVAIANVESGIASQFVAPMNKLVRRSDDTNASEDSPEA